MKLNKLLGAAFICCACTGFGTAFAEPDDTVTAEVFTATLEGSGMSVGTVTFIDEPDGLAIRVNLRGLPPGEHGFHVHEKPDCSPMADQNGKMTPAGGAGGHYDPDKTGKHLGPNGGGHKGDLPVLTVGQDGTATRSFDLRLKGVKAADFKNRAIMIHAGGDNYSDQPAPLGGGAGRIACGIIK